jgi:NADH-quinone oxidoreductase subunit H
MQSRVGPRWFQPLADMIKLLAKEEIVPEGTDRWIILVLPMVAVAAVLTAALYVPLLGLAPADSFEGDLVVTIYLLSVLTLCLGIAGSNTRDRFAIVGATRALTQLFAYEAPFLLALLGPALVAGTWQISGIHSYAQTHWLLLTQPVGFVIALVGLVGKLELPPFDAPEAETEIVAGALTEYSGPGLALFRLARHLTLVVGLTLVAGFYLGGLANPLQFIIKVGLLLFSVAVLQVLFARLRIDQTLDLWWRYGAFAALGQLFVTLLLQGTHL